MNILYNIYKLSFSLYYFMIIIMMLISVAFLTLFERKFLSYIQYRKGPNKLGFLGILQPFSDAIKLFSKENMILMTINRILYFLTPMMSFLFCLISWMILFPIIFENMFSEHGILMMMSIMSISAFTIMFSGWASNSNYSMLGAIRALNQSLSYEISFFLIIFMNIIMIENFEFKNFFLLQKNMSFLIFLFPLFILFYTSIIAELNRSPFDLTESESELVSGFNTEYMSASFAMIFLAEYSFIILYNYLMIIMFLGYKNIMLFFFLIIMNFIIITLRAICPRIRYDQLMYMCWLKILPTTLYFMMFILMMKFMYFYL